MISKITFSLSGNKMKSHLNKLILRSLDVQQYDYLSLEKGKPELCGRKTLFHGQQFANNFRSVYRAFISRTQ